MTNKTTIQIMEQEFQLDAGTSLGISSSDSDMIKTLLYDLSKQNPRSTLYINHHQMLYPTMNVLEFLMFACRHLRKSDPVTRQLELLDLLTSVGLGYISLTPVNSLTTQEQMVVLLCVALYSKESILILDFTAYEFNMELIACIDQLIHRLKKPDTLLILGTMQPKLIGICLTETIFIHDQKIRYYGSVSDLYHSMDRVLYVLSHTDTDLLVPQLKHAFPIYEIRSTNSLIFVMRTSSNRDDAYFFSTLAREMIIPDSIKINHGRVENSFQELIEFNDILI